MMRDMFGRAITEGALVGFNPPRYKGLLPGRVVRFTPKKVVVRYAANHFSTEPFATTTVFPNDLIVDIGSAGAR